MHARVENRAICTRGEDLLSNSDTPLRLHVAFAQTRPVWGDLAGNLEAVRRLLHDSIFAHRDTENSVDLLVLPELFASGYVFRDRGELESLAENENGLTLNALRRWAETSKATIVAGFPERESDAIFNSAALVSPSGEIRVYRKIHLFDRERLLFEPGDRPFEAWDVATPRGSARVGVLICFDWFFPESARSLALDGAEILLHPANLVLPWCQEAMRTRCLENRVIAVTANRVGKDEREPAPSDLNLTFTGQSQIVGVRGDVLRRAGVAEECVGTAWVDLESARSKRVASNDLFRDRRPEMYREFPRGRSPE